MNVIYASPYRYFNLIIFVNIKSSINYKEISIDLADVLQILISLEIVKELEYTLSGEYIRPILLIRYFI